MDTQTYSTFYEDKEIECCDCHQTFTFTGGEQRFFAERQFTEPKRCKPCRDEKKARRNERQEQDSHSQVWEDDRQDRGRRRRSR